MNYREFSDNALRTFAREGDQGAIAEIKRREHEADEERKRKAAYDLANAYIKRRGGEPHVPNRKP